MNSGIASSGETHRRGARAGQPVRSTCPYCGVGCGIQVRTAAAGPEIAGDPSHPANQGRLCVKGAALGQTLVPEGRLLTPRVDGEDVPWPTAIAAVADRLRQARAQHGPGSVAFYLSGQLLTEDYYVANKLAKGFLGTPHVDTNSRLCMSSAVAAHKRAFGEDVVPGCYEDVELADLVVLAGSNAAWAHPVLFQRMQGSARTGRKVVLIDPRRTATADLADLHLPLRPGTDTCLFNGLLVWLADHGALDTDYLANHCSGLDDALACARADAPSLAAVARTCDLPEDDLRRFYTWFARTPRTVTAFSQGINQSVAGTDKGNAIINVHLATGRVGRPGAGPLSLTGQPNAMGGREVGGLANTLAAHLDYDTPGARDAVARFWGSPGLADGPGLKAVDLFEAVQRGDIQVLWIAGTNPAVSLPDSDRVRDALRRCPTVIVSDCVANTDTSALADIQLPAAAWGEKDGTVTNSERCLSRQRGFLPLPGEARPDWWMFQAVAQALGHGAAFRFADSAAVFREHAALTGVAAQLGRALDLSALADLSGADYQRLSPIRWPVRRNPSGVAGTDRLFGDGHFATPDGRARLVPVRVRDALPEPAVAAAGETVLTVNTGRYRDQWHTMTRTGLAPSLLAHRGQPMIDMHPEDARRTGLTDGALAVLRRPDARPGGRNPSEAAQVVAPVRITTAQRPGEVFVPIHWSRRFSGSALASELMTRLTDPVSGQPDSKRGLARVAPLATDWQARLLRHREAGPWQAGQWPANNGVLAYHCRQPLAHSDSWWLAGRGTPDWAELAGELLGGTPQLVLSDTAAGRFRAVRMAGPSVVAVLLVEPPAGLLPETAWLDGCLGGEALADEQRRWLLAGAAPDGPDPGPVVCSCHQVGRNEILAAMDEGCDTVQSLGARLRCGTQCGSCLPELRALLAGEAETAG
ncbi:nitrate reductase [Marinobacter sp. C2H3]|uniref:nitrate reductase n=1 Tax=Marinobacter sp. C2H3 TaxID=3119003 RepID=UPI00300EF23F